MKRRFWLLFACATLLSIPAVALAQEAAPVGESEMELSRAERKKGGSGRTFHRLQWLTLSSITGGAVLIQENKHQCRIHVLKGTAIVRSELDRSILKVSAGTVYESVRKAGGSVQYNSFKDLTDGSTGFAVFETTTSRTALLLMASTGKPNELRAEILSPPTIRNYEVGEATLKQMPIPPQMVSHFPPSGVIPDRAEAIANQRNPN
jgi:hypothetical protein